MSHLTEGSETRARAAETKFVVDPAVGEQIPGHGRVKQLKADPHGTGDFGDQYRTTSVYFDTSDYDVFYRRRLFGRSKYRARRYGSSESVFLERKLTRPGLVTKRRTRVGVEAFSSGGYAGSVFGGWFHRRLAARGLKPVCQVSYLRTARMATTDSGPIRLTLDEDVRALPANGWTFSPVSVGPARR